MARVASDEDEIDLGRILAQLWAGRFRIAGSTAAAAVLALVHLADTPPTFRAEALLQLEEKAAQALPAALSDIAGLEPRIAAEIEILRSHSVLAEAVAAHRLDLQALPVQAPVLGHAVASGRLPLPDSGILGAYDRGDGRILLDLLEVPSEWVDEWIRLTATGNGGFTLSLPDGRRLDGQVGEPLLWPEAGFGLRIVGLEAPAGRQFRLRRQDEIGAIEALRGRLSVSERGRGALILDVTLTGPDPVEAQAALAAVTDAYLRQNRGRSAAEAQSSLDFIEHQLPGAREAVARVEDRLEAYRQAQHTLAPDLESLSLLNEIRAAETELRELSGKEEDLARRFTPLHPAYQKLLAARARAEDRLAGLRQEAAGLPETQRGLFNLSRELDVARQVHLDLLNRAQELRVLTASTLGNARLLDAARARPAPVAPRRGRVLALALLLGALGGAGYVLGRNWLQAVILGPEDLDRLGLPVYATVLLAPQAVRQRGDRRPWPILALTDPDCVTLEGIRLLRAGLHFGREAARSRSVGFTSPSSGAGKSFLAANLAVVEAQAGQRVCLVDTDLRRGDLRRYFGMSRGTPGLSDYLSGSAAVDDLLRPGPVEDLMVLTAGRLPPHPSELLLRPAFAHLVAELDRRFDLVIFDMPPALAVTDAAVIGRTMGIMLAVLRHAITEREEVEVMIRQMQGAGVTLGGAVINGYRPCGRRGAYGYRYDDSYSYRSGQEA
uniref:Non-specific protein-tyrosine kinase n=1 Tax=Cereibacter sphaeroides (strain ATCC 17025 / ATH 2.4.3) TaxID=349102 RepID=A4WZY9_CERS5